MPAALHHITLKLSAGPFYIVTEPVDKQRLQPLVRVLVNMIVRLSATGLSFEGGMPKPKYLHRLLLMLDEFPSLRKLDILQESLAFLPGYGIKAYLIAQDINQLYAHYGRDEAITLDVMKQSPRPATCNVPLLQIGSKPLNTSQN